MKKIVFFLTLTATGFAASAQTVKLKKGQVVTITSATSQDIDMGMGGQMTSNSKSTSVLEIKNTDKSNYQAVTKLSKLSMTMDAMGQSQSFDSEKPEDLQSEIGKAVGDKIGKEANVTIDNTTGKVTAEKAATEDTDKKEDDPMSGLMNMFGNTDNTAATAESIIFILPAAKKAGDTWQDSSEVKNNSKIYKTYTLKSLQDGIATIALSSKSKGSFSTEAQGMQMDIALDTKSEGEMIVDTKTSLLKKINRTVNVEGTLEVMGQSVPITSKATEAIEIQ
ncbi:MAG: DUF6263 family protein [Ferruginibacter sp.]